MTTWREARAKLHAGNPLLKDEYDRLGPRFETLSKLIDARERLKISQSELARRMDVQPNVVSRFESAQHSPRLDTIIAYAHALGYEFKVALKKQPDGAGVASGNAPITARRSSAAHPVRAKRAVSRRPRLSR
jgi:transcriptional regulator with XRE-family HTH domain